MAEGQPWVDWEWVGGHGDLIVDLVAQHLLLTGLAVVLGLAISVPLALAAHRWRRVASPVLGVTGGLYTIPSLALFALLIPWTGLSRTTALIALTSYTLLILVRNTLAGLDAVPGEVREAAEGMGYRRARRLLRVELPLALPVVVAGVRTAAVQVVATATLAAVVGYGGLGALILIGLRTGDNVEVVAGAATVAALALMVDLGLGLAQRALTAEPLRRRGRLGTADEASVPRPA